MMNSTEQIRVKIANIVFTNLEFCFNIVRFNSRTLIHESLIFLHFVNRIHFILYKVSFRVTGSNKLGFAGNVVII